MSNNHLRNKDLSWKAKGILSYILSLPSDWTLYASELSSRAKDGRESLYSGIKELEKHGYIIKYKIKDTKKRFCGYKYIVIEAPNTITSSEYLNPLNTNEVEIIDIIKDSLSTEKEKNTQNHGGKK